MKISTKLISSSAITLLALATSAPVIAAETKPSTANSNGRISLIADPNQDHPGGEDDGGDGKDPQPPVDPEHPGDGNGNDNTGNKGDFTLDVVPNYDFGTQKLDGTAHTWNALFFDADKKAVVEGRNSNPYVQVTDIRPENTGWHVTVKIDDFKTADGKLLSGTVLTLPKGTAKAADESNKSGDPAINGIEGVNGDDQVLMSSEAGKGTGTWRDIMFDNKDDNQLPTTLFVPGSASAGDYTANLTWTLADTPNV